VNDREKNNRGGRRIHRAFCESATSEDDTHGKKQPMCAPLGGRIRDSKVGAPGVYFFEKQSHQVIENTNERPKFGQNNPKFGHLAGWGDSKPMVGCSSLLRPGSGGQRDGRNEFGQEKDVGQ